MEFILVTAMIVGVILAVLWPLFSTKMQAIQDDLNDRALTILRQDQLGIPLAWFDGKIGSIQDAANVLDQAGQTPGGGGSGADDQNLGGENGNDGDADGNGRDGADRGDNSNGADGANGGGSGSGRGGGAGANGRGVRGGAAGQPSGGSNRRGGRGSSGEDDGDTEIDNGGETQRRRNRSAAERERSYGEPAQTPEEQEAEQTALEGEAGQEDKESAEADNRRRLKGENFDREAAKGSCREMNVFAMLKIVAILLVLVIGGVILFMGSTKGKGEP